MNLTVISKTGYQVALSYGCVNFPEGNFLNDGSLEMLLEFCTKRVAKLNTKICWQIWVQTSSLSSPVYKLPLKQFKAPLMQFRWQIWSVTGRMCIYRRRFLLFWAGGKRFAPDSSVPCCYSGIQTYDTPPWRILFSYHIYYAKGAKSLWKGDDYFTLPLFAVFCWG